MMPSNMIAANDNPNKTMFRNLARGFGVKPEDAPDVNEQIRKELTAAGISLCSIKLPVKGEVPTDQLGFKRHWKFERAWYYYRASGPGIPPQIAEEFHKTWGRQVRVQGHCGCPSPLEYCCGFAVDNYHIDTQEGLKAFADLLESIHIPIPEAPNCGNS